MKLLIHSNGPHVATGYGVQTSLLSERLRDAGHDVAISCTYGLQGGSITRRGIVLYPARYETNGNDVIHNHALHHFGGDPLGGWIVTLLDVWALVNPVLADFNVAAWCPVDHFPVPPDVLKFFHRTGATPVAMSRFGERLLFDAGLDPVYIPLAVDTSVYEPTPTLSIGGSEVTGRELIGVPDDAFVVGMVGMNKGWARDRKGFNEALRAFGAFWKRQQDAVLYVHADWPGGAEGMNLKELATHAAIPEHAIFFPDLYAYTFGFTPEMMAATYTAFDVLLAPSHGEGFCVPLIEAQACGTPVIVTDFSAQQELVGAGWRVAGQPEWDPAQHASYICPFIGDIVAALEASHGADRTEMAGPAIEFARQYDADRVFHDYWVPFLASLEAEPETLDLDRTEPFEVAVIVPLMRHENRERLENSFNDTNDGTAQLVFVYDEPLIGYVGDVGWGCTRQPVTSFSEKVNVGVERTTQPWLLLVGDDVEFKPGWLEAARKVSDRFDVIGTNDTEHGTKNPAVASGAHADHFFVRRAYVEEYGASLDGPGVLAPECYRHWFTDREIVQLAKARGVFTPCLESVVEHHHPGFDGREDLRRQDPVYMAAVDHAEQDRKTWLSRLPLIEQQRTSRGKR